MGDMWRSQKMQLVQMIVQNDAAHAVVNKLGQVGILEFRDLNAGTSFYKRSFVEEVRKCEDLQRILRAIGEEYEDTQIKFADKDESRAMSLSLDDVETKIRDVEEELTGLKTTQDVRRLPSLSHIHTLPAVFPSLLPPLPPRTQANLHMKPTPCSKAHAHPSLPAATAAATAPPPSPARCRSCSSATTTPSSSRSSSSSSGARSTASRALPRARAAAASRTRRRTSRTRRS